MKAKTLLFISVLYFITFGCAEYTIIEPSDIHHENWERVNSWEVHLIRKQVRRKDYVSTFFEQPERSYIGYSTIRKTDTGYRYEDYDINVKGQERTYSVELDFDGSIYRMRKKSDQLESASWSKAKYNPKTATTVSETTWERFGDRPANGWSDRTEKHLTDGTVLSESKAYRETADTIENFHSLGQYFSDGSSESYWVSDDKERAFACVSDNKQLSLSRQVNADLDDLLSNFTITKRTQRICGPEPDGITGIYYDLITQTGDELRISIGYYHENASDPLPERQPRSIWLSFSAPDGKGYNVRKWYKEEIVGVSVVELNANQLTNVQTNYKILSLRDFAEQLTDETIQWHKEYRYTYY